MSFTNVNPTSPFQLTGLASGLDTNALISALMQIEAQPRTQLANQETVVNAHQAALNDVKTKLQAVSDALDALRSPTLFTNVQSVAASDPTMIGVQSTSGAAVGGYQIAVTQLARSAQRTFTYAAPAADSTLEIDYQQPGGSPQTYTTTVSAGTSLDSLVAQINGDLNAPVYAADVNGNLVFSDRTTGQAATFTATASFLTENTGAAVAGRDAQFSVDNGPVQSSSSNVVNSAIPGVTLTLKGVTSAPVTVTVSPPAPDPDAVKSAVHAFVDAYNAAVDDIQGKLNEQKVPNPQNDSDRTKGVLFGDTDLSGLLDNLRQTMYQTFSGISGGLQSLLDIGISTGDATGGTINQDAVDGKLTVDDDKLTAALQANPGGVQELLGASGSVSGFAQAFGAALSPYVQSGGDLDQRISSDASEISDLQSQMADWDQRLSDRQTALQAQFAQLESVLSQNQSQQQWLSQQLLSLPQG